MKLPFMKFYPTDWRMNKKVRRLTLEEKGCYLELLIELWTSDEPYLPNDPKTIAQLLQISAKKFEKFWKIFQKNGEEIFKLTEDGKYFFQERLLNEWEKAKEKSKTMADVALNRWSNKDDTNAMQKHNKSNAKAMQMQCKGNDIKDIRYKNTDTDINNIYINNNNNLSLFEKDKELEKESEREKEQEREKVRTRTTITYPQDFEEFWKIYPHFNRDKRGTYQLWNLTIAGTGRTSPATKQELLTAAKNYLVSIQRKGTTKDYVMHGTTFLGTHERWREYSTDNTNVNTVADCEPESEISRLSTAKQKERERKLEILDKLGIEVSSLDDIDNKYNDRIREYEQRNNMENQSESSDGTGAETD